MSEAWAASWRATIRRPLVSRSRRWTMPGRRTPAIPPNDGPWLPRRGFTRVPSAWPAGGWIRGVPVAVPRRGMAHEARGLVDDEEVLVLVDHGDLDRCIADELRRS